MALDPDLRVFLDQVAANEQRPMSEVTPEELRQQFNVFGNLGTTIEEGIRTEDLIIPGPASDLAVRAFHPDALGPLPIVVFFHGGGFVIGSIDSHDPLCRRLAAGVPAVVVSIDYRLAPEHPFPAAVEDCLGATDWVAAHAVELGGDPARIAVAGDSAGGNLAAVVSRRARDAGAPAISFQLLIYPAVDCTRSLPSHVENGQGYLLTNESMDWFMDHYFGGQDASQPDASPYFVEDLSGLPPACVITAEFDPLRDEGEAYARRMSEAGVDVLATRYDGMIHGFVQLDLVVPAAGQALEDAVAALQEAFAATPAK